jgi:hypothetical protein
MVPLTYAVAGALALNLTGASHSFLSIVYAILGISALIFVHELGHFLACGWARVETFRSSGRACSAGSAKGGKRRPGSARQTDRRGRHGRPHRPDPLGGYVKMVARSAATERHAGSARASCSPTSSGKQTQRFLIAVAGVMNAMPRSSAPRSRTPSASEDPGRRRRRDPGRPAGAGGGPATSSTYGGQRLRTFSDLAGGHPPREKAPRRWRGGQLVTFRVADLDPSSGFQGSRSTLARCCRRGDGVEVR